MPTGSVNSPSFLMSVPDNRVRSARSICPYPRHRYILKEYPLAGQGCCTSAITHLTVVYILYVISYSTEDTRTLQNMAFEDCAAIFILYSVEIFLELLLSLRDFLLCHAPHYATTPFFPSPILLTYSLRVAMSDCETERRR